jgi:hypothetical protein
MPESWLWSEWDDAPPSVAVGSPDGVVSCGDCVSMAAVGLLGGLVASMLLCEPPSSPPATPVSMGSVGSLGGLVPSLWLREPPSPPPVIPVSIGADGLFCGLISSLWLGESPSPPPAIPVSMAAGESLRGPVVSSVVSMSAEALVEASEGLPPSSGPGPLGAPVCESAVGVAAFCAAVTAC